MLMISSLFFGPVAYTQFDRTCLYPCLNSSSFLESKKELGGHGVRLSYGYHNATKFPGVITGVGKYEHRAVERVY
jgi:hypothetical protein